VVFKTRKRSSELFLAAKIIGGFSKGSDGMKKRRDNLRSIETRICFKGACSKTRSCFWKGLTISSEIGKSFERWPRGFEGQRGESMSDERIFGSASREEARGGARGAGRSVERSNLESVTNGVRSYETLRWKTETVPRGR
jgi:hypothetical protein